MVVSNAKVFIAAIFLMTAVGCWSAVGNAAFIAPRGKTIFARSHKRTWTGSASTDRCDPTHARFRCDVAGVRFCIVLYRFVSFVSPRAERGSENTNPAKCRRPKISTGPDQVLGLEAAGK